MKNTKVQKWKRCKDVECRIKKMWKSKSQKMWKCKENKRGIWE